MSEHLPDFGVQQHAALSEERWSAFTLDQHRTPGHSYPGCWVDASTKGFVLDHV